MPNWEADSNAVALLNFDSYPFVDGSQTTGLSSITNSSGSLSVATISGTSHNLQVGQVVKITGNSNSLFNSYWTITATTGTTFSWSQTVTPTQTGTGGSAQPWPSPAFIYNYANLTFGTTNSAVTFTAQAQGSAQTAITVAFVSAGSFSVGVVGNAITVNFVSGTTTANAVQAGVNASTSAAALVVAKAGGTGAGTVAAHAATALAMTGITSVTNTVTINTAQPHGLVAGQSVIITGVFPTTYNGIFKTITTPTTSSLTYTQTGIGTGTGAGGQIDPATYCIDTSASPAAYELLYTGTAGAATTVTEVVGYNQNGVSFAASASAEYISNGTVQNTRFDTQDFTIDALLLISALPTINTNFVSLQSSGSDKLYLTLTTTGTVNAAAVNSGAGTATATGTTVLFPSVNWFHIRLTWQLNTGIVSILHAPVGEVPLLDATATMVGTPLLNTIYNVVVHSTTSGELDNIDSVRFSAVLRTDAYPVNPFPTPPTGFTNGGNTVTVDAPKAYLADILSLYYTTVLRAIALRAGPTSVPASAQPTVNFIMRGLVISPPMIVYWHVVNVPDPTGAQSGYSGNITDIGIESQYLTP